jgi:hypothetical protein
VCCSSGNSSSVTAAHCVVFKDLLYNTPVLKEVFSEVLLFTVLLLKDLLFKIQPLNFFFEALLNQTQGFVVQDNSVQDTAVQNAIVQGTLVQGTAFEAIIGLFKIPMPRVLLFKALLFKKLLLNVVLFKALLVKKLVLKGTV